MATSKAAGKKQLPAELSNDKNSKPVSVLGEHAKNGDDKGAVRVFVYGSLKTQHGNNVLLQQAGAKCLGYDSITGDFTMISFGGFPGVVRTTTEGGAARPITTIYGEVWMTDEEGLAAMDMLENHPNWYERIKYRTDVLDRRAWMYTLPLGNGYLETGRYTPVPDCIWGPDKAETEFWNKQVSANGS